MQTGEIGKHELNKFFTFVVRSICNRNENILQAKMKGILKTGIIGMSILLMACNNQSEEKTNNSTTTEQDSKGKVAVTKHGEKFVSAFASKLNSEGVDLTEAGKMGEARDKLKEALVFEPRNATVLNNLGLVELQCENYNEAIEYFNKSLAETDSSYLNSAVNMGLTFYYMKKYDECVKISEYVVGKTKDTVLNAGAHLNLTLSFSDQGKCKKAKQEYELTYALLRGNAAASNQMERLKQKVAACK
jgi:tetratricopeptide (TPR) repeat protein